MQAYVRSADGVDDKQQLIRDMGGWIDESIAELERLGLFESQPAG